MYPIAQLLVALLVVTQGVKVAMVAGEKVVLDFCSFMTKNITAQPTPQSQKFTCTATKYSATIQNFGYFTADCSGTAASVLQQTGITFPMSVMQAEVGSCDADHDSLVMHVYNDEECAGPVMVSLIQATSLECKSTGTFGVCVPYSDEFGFKSTYLPHSGQTGYTPSYTGMYMMVTCNVAPVASTTSMSAGGIGSFVAATAVLLQ